MLTNQIPWQEPTVIAAGDTLQFNRRLPDYPSSQGWLITYEIRGGAAAIQFVSTPDQDTVSQDIYVAPAVTSLWLPGQMLMVGYVSNGIDRFQVYYAELTILKNLEGSNANVNVKTFKQQTLENMEVCLTSFLTSGLLETRIGETMFRYTSSKELYFAYGLAWQMRNNEIQLERASNGQATSQKMRPRVNITQPGPLAGQVLWPAGWGAS